MFAMVDGKYFPATLALAGHCDDLVDGSGVVFTELNHTINLRIEVFDLFVIPGLSVDTTSTSTVAWVRWMVGAGEHCVP